MRTVVAMSSGATCGRTCWTTIRRWLAPSERARFTYTRSRMLFTCARTMRAVVVHSSSPITRITCDRLGPNTVATTIISTRSGMTRK